jgi:hypothetical protein
MGLCTLDSDARGLEMQILRRAYPMNHAPGSRGPNRPGSQDEKVLRLRKKWTTGGVR